MSVLRPLLSPAGTTCLRVPRKLSVRGPRRFLHAVPSPRALEALDEWISVEKTLTISDTIRPEHLSDLYVTLPTRDGSQRLYAPPKMGSPLAYGHHLVFFHPRNRESALRSDGTDADFCPPEPFTRRMWAGGRFDWKLQGEEGLLIGDGVQAVSRIKEVQKKGFHPGGTPMVFVKQSIEYSKEGTGRVALEEERSHVYLAAPAHRRAVREVDHLRDIAKDRPWLDLEYLPSATMLFRFSALTFNGHHIHLNKEYARSEGYPERLVHAPLTALMLLELATNGLSEDLRIETFEYKAHNPMLVNRPVMLNAAWDDKANLDLWAADEETGTVGMTATLRRGL